MYYQLVNVLLEGTVTQNMLKKNYLTSNNKPQLTDVWHTKT